MNGTDGRFARAKTEAEKDFPNSERFFSIAIVVLSVLMVLYFVAHQRRSTGFFSDSFGAPEMFMLYSFWGFWIVTSGLEGLFGLRFLSRLIDSFGGLVFASIAIVWLLVVFPFDFAHFADVLPDSLSFMLQWISDNIARVLMVLGIIVHLGAAIYSPFAYKFVERKRPKRDKSLDGAT